MSIKEMKIIYIIFCILILLSFTADAKLLKPWEYPEGSCIRYSEDFQKEFGGQFIIIVPDEGYRYLTPGHFMNNITIGGKIYYIDWREQRIFSNKQTVLGWFNDMGKAYNSSFNSSLQDLGVGW